MLRELLPGILAVTAFAATLLAWYAKSRKAESEGTRYSFAGLLVAGFAGWAASIAGGLFLVRDAAVLRALGAIGIALPVFLFVQYLAGRLRERVRVSNSMLLLGCFIVLPTIFFGTFYVLGRPPAVLVSGRISLYYAIFAFFALATAWAKGAKTPAYEDDVTGESQPPPTCAASPDSR